MIKKVPKGSFRTEKKAREILESEKRGLRSAKPFIGPAIVASVAYIDPGNFASNIQSGAQFGYLLAWVVILANLMGMLVQFLSAKLGVATGKNLAELCHDHFPKPVSYLLWIIAEIIAMATDLAEFVGAALGFHLLFKFPLLQSGFLTALCIFLLLVLERKGFRPLEIAIAILVAIIIIAFAMQVFFANPNPKDILEGLIPRFAGKDSILLATAILGATVMPHVIFLHSALTQKRILVKTEAEQKKLIRYQIIDVVFAMGIAGLINLSMLVLAAAVFHSQGLYSIHNIQPAFDALGKYVGNYTDELFGIALLASGISSSIVGTMAGQVVMAGFISFQIPLFIRRAVTMIPSLIVLAGMMNPTRAMILSQVVLSFGLPFSLIPLIVFTTKKQLMGIFTNRVYTSFLALIITLAVLTLNGYLLYQTFRDSL